MIKGMCHEAQLKLFKKKKKAYTQGKTTKTTTNTSLPKIWRNARLSRLVKAMGSIPILKEAKSNPYPINCPPFTQKTDNKCEFKFYH